MNTRKLPINISARQQGYIALVLWGIVALLLVRQDVYGLDESAARPLLLSWSIAGELANPVAFLGMPDLRILLFLPVGFLWAGNVFAAKVLTALVLAVTAWLLYGWNSRVAGAESALLATGLLLISPLALAQLDAISPGIYLLATFGLGAWLDAQYRDNPRPFNGWYFAQLIVCAFSVSLHPAGLAYPLAALWSWRTLPQSPKNQKFFLGGIVFATALMLALRNMGWGDLAWFQNPLISLGSIFTGALPDDAQPVLQWLSGGLILAVAAAVVLLKWRELWADVTGRALLIGLLLGATVGDQTWGLIALCIVLYSGLPLLLRPGSTSSDSGFMKQRGWVLVLIFICSTIFMRADKAYYEAGQSGVLAAQDDLIRTLAVAAENDRKAGEAEDGQGQRPRFIVASQWPGRTMLACKCDTFPLPPVKRDDPEAQLASLHSITYLLFDPKHTANIDLARNFALLGGAVETVSLQPGGVMLHVKEADAPKPGGKNSK